ncbi:MAG: M20 family metallopeptidase [Gemmatimonadota bacterium]|nr:M20 family metallopeptidase [Gemmatimonadota bacterium]MDH3422538.1 M20 family metallopeptidase [Gemmatimonadota bacterium]
MTVDLARGADIVAVLQERRDQMVDMLVAIASLESPTDVLESQEPVQRHLTDALTGLGFEVRKIPGRATGGHLYARPLERKRGRPGQLLVGHTDTVWPVGTLRSMPVVVENGHVKGPGTFDMKAGLVQGIFALTALAALGLEPPATPVWLINSDEETGSPESRRWMRLLARRVARAYVLEPAFGPEGRLKTARKGVARYTVTVRGKAAHAGLDPTAGASAIAELASVVQRLHQLTDLERGTTVNVGMIKGGTRANVIAAEASAEVDVRMMTVADGEQVDRDIRALTALTAGTSIHVEKGIFITPFERTGRNRVLWDAAFQAGARLGLDLQEFAAGGGSDGNTTSQFTATLDGLGAIGDGAHALHEAVLIDGMVERAALLAELLMAPLET